MVFASLLDLNLTSTVTHKLCVESKYMLYALPNFRSLGDIREAIGKTDFKLTVAPEGWRRSLRWKLEDWA